jgi:hypothetical protein
VSNLKEIVRINYRSIAFKTRFDTDQIQVKHIFHFNTQYGNNRSKRIYFLGYDRSKENKAFKIYKIK